MSCDDRAAFIVGDLAPERRAAFEAHLATCAACQQAVAAAKADEAALREWAKAPAAPPFAATKLVQRAKTPRPARPGPLRVVVAAALALGVATVLFKPGAPETMVLEAEGTVAVFGDSVVVEPGSRADVTRSADETRVRLARGGMKFQVAKRKPGQRFVVESGDVEVRVVGTTFTVRTGAQPSVAVDEGVVEVYRAGTRVAAVRAGEAWPSIVVETPPESVDAGSGAEPIDAGVEPAQTPVKPARAYDYAPITQAMVQNRLDDAKRLLDARLADEPRDAQAWVLRGHLLKRTRELEPAVKAYLRSAALADGEARNSARLLAAALLQDTLQNGPQARAVLDAMLADKRGAKALVPIALVRLAKLDLAEGKPAAAKLRLRLVLEKHATTPSAVEARTLLEGLQ